MNKFWDKLKNLFVVKKEDDGWGYHLVIDASDGIPCAIQDPEHLKNWVKDFVQTIGMEADGEPFIKHYELDNPSLCGYTVFQMITTSNITCHFNDLDNSGFIDVFSCKKFDPKVAVNHIRAWLGFEKLVCTFKVRSVPE